MGHAIKDSMEVTDKKRAKSAKGFINWKSITLLIIIVAAFIIGGMSYYQANHFNAKVSINGTNVGGLTTEQALKKLQSAVSKNVVYVGGQQIIDGKDTKFGFTEKDLPNLEKLLKTQWTFFPTATKKEYLFVPSNQDEYRSGVLKKEFEQKLIAMNQDLKAPKDAQAVLEQGKIVVTESANGEQYDVSSLLKDYDRQLSSSEIQLKPVFIEPVKEDSPIVKSEKEKLQQLLQQTVDYQVQDQLFTLNASELIQNATVTKELKVSIDPSSLTNKISEINEAKSTLNKNLNFTTHSGAVISVKGQGYGWALNVEKESAMIKAAFENGEKTTQASNIYGNGWGNEALGYDATANSGIGDTYAEVSIAEQRIWIYRAGQMVFTTHVVTGKRSTGEVTSPGVWYILYKKTPYTLKGTAVGKGSYTANVSYWAPFTNTGQGFHDASWRTNWESNAYLTQGSAGCVNVPPNVMKSVYDNLSVHQPVVVY